LRTILTSFRDGTLAGTIPVRRQHGVKDLLAEIAVGDAGQTVLPDLPKGRLAQDFEQSGAGANGMGIDGDHSRTRLALPGPVKSAPDYCLQESARAMPPSLIRNHHRRRPRWRP
jgi:hypothetical protein